MLTQEDLRTYHTGFELFDPFGKGRMTELAYDYKLQLAQDKAEIELWKERFAEQAKAINLLVKLKAEPSEFLVEENKKLTKELKNANATISSLTSWAERLEGLLNENGIYVPGAPKPTNITSKEESA